MSGPYRDEDRRPLSDKVATALDLARDKFAKSPAVTKTYDAMARFIEDTLAAWGVHTNVAPFAEKGRVEFRVYVNSEIRQIQITNRVIV